MSDIKVQRKLFHATIVANFPLRKPGLQENYLVQVQINQELTCQPGQFFKFDLTEQLGRRSLQIIEAHNDHSPLQIKNLHPENDFLRRQPLLARPYSVGLCRPVPGGTMLTFLYKILGPGSSKLAELKAGQKLVVLGPLGGSGFYRPKNKTRALMVAGGVGLPPLLFLSGNLLQEQIESIHLFIGANTSDKLPLHADYQKGLKVRDCRDWPDIFRHLADPRMTIRVSTDDGSEGHKGLATEMLERHLEEVPAGTAEKMIIYTCGPWRMMARAAEITRTCRIPCQVCLEEMMGCGIGACQSCVTKVKSNSEKGWEFKLVCRDGPVFDANEVSWEK
jgi:dihydroorotate dehydrogenase electron transfer subunit